MSDKERLIVQLEARISDFEKRMKKAEKTGTKSYTRLRKGSRSATRAMERDMLRSTCAINKALATTSTRIGGFGKAFAAGLTVTALTGAARGLASVVKGMASVGDEAKRSGLSVKTFQEWKFVAEQNRIGIDSMVDGFKELNLRADEFVVTGKGPAAEAFERIGYTASQLKRKLKDPSNLMLEIVGRLGKLDKAAQIRVADEVFGGSAGERFVELIGQGEQGLRQTISRAHELGAVMDSEMIAKADELDRKFGELQTRVSNFAKGLAVAVAESFSGPDLEGMFQSEERARAVLGDAIIDKHGDSIQWAEQHQDAIEGLTQEYGDLETAVLTASRAIGAEVPTILELDDLDAAIELSDISAQMQILVSEFRSGVIPAQEFEDGIASLVTEAGDAFTALEAIDGVDFGFVVGAIGRISSALSGAIERATTLRSELPGADASNSISYGPQSRRGHRKGKPPTSSPRPLIRPNMLGEPPLPSSGGGGGDDFARQVASIQDKTAALNAEAVALLAAAASGKEYGQALDYARKRAELMNAAQKTGKEITPELQAEIDALAASYVSAGDAANDAADKLEKIENSAELGADAIANIFMGVVDGSRSAKEAVADLLKEIARIQFQKSVAGLFGGAGGIGGFIGGLLGFADGGAFNQGRVIPFASGGVVSGPSFFGMAGGKTGLMGEAGPEAIMPLSRGSDGKLGVRASGGGGGDTYNFAPVIHVEGDGDNVNRIEQALARANAEFENRVITTVNTAKRRRMII